MYKLLIIFVVPFFLCWEAFGKGCHLKFAFDKQGNLTEMSLSMKGCTLNDLDQFSRSLSGDQRDSFDNLVRDSLGLGEVKLHGERMCEVGPCIPCTVSEYGICSPYEVLPNSQFLVSIKSSEKEPPDNGRSYADYLGVPEFDPRDLPPVISRKVSESGVWNKETLTGALNLAHSIVAISQAGTTISHEGKLIKHSWDVLVLGKKQVDLRAEASLAVQKEELRQLFNRSIQEVDQAIQDTLEIGKRAQVKYKVQYGESQLNFEGIQKNVMDASDSIKSAKDKAGKAQTLTSELEKSALDAAAQTAEELERLKAGMLPRQAVKKLQQKLVGSLGSDSPEKLAKNISQIQGMAAKARNVAQKEQYKNMLRAITNSNGYVTSYAGIAGIPGNLELKTDEFSKEGRAVRQNFNEALGAIAKDERNIQEVGPEHALELLIKADKKIAEGERRIGDRLLSQARSLLDFHAGNRRIDVYQQVSFSPQARNLFSISNSHRSATGYQDYQYKKIANLFAAMNPEGLSNDAYMASQLAVRQVGNLASDRDYGDFNRALQVATTVYDFNMGVGRGLIGGAVDMVSGIGNIIMHPVDTVEGLANAIVNYDKTYDAAVKAAIDFIEELPNATPEEYGELTGRIAFEIASAFTGAGIAKQGLKVAQVAKHPAVVGAAARYGGFRGVLDSAGKMGMSKAEDIKAWAGAISDVSETRVSKIISESKRITPDSSIQSIDPDVIKFSQSSVNGAGELTASMKASGWLGDPINVVKMPDGTLIAADNTRVLAASRAGIETKAIVKSGSEGLSPEMAERFTTSAGVPKTWEEAIRYRIGKQKKAYSEKYPNGSYVTQSLD